VHDSTGFSFVSEGSGLASPAFGRYSFINAAVLFARTQPTPRECALQGHSVLAAQIVPHVSQLLHHSPHTEASLPIAARACTAGALR